MGGESAARRGKGIGQFYLFYGLVYVTTACNSVLSVYYDAAGLTATQIGQVLAMGAVMGFLAQPVWGWAGDHSRSKMRLVQLLVLAMIVVISLIQLNNTFPYIIVMASLFYFFLKPLNPMVDSVAIEYLDSVGGSYSRARACGPIGYGLTTLVTGALMDRSAGNVFYVLLAALGVLAVLCFFMPVVPGRQSSAAQGKKASMWLLFRDRELVVLLVTFVLMQVSNNFYHNFLPLFYQELGGDNTLMGIGLAICAASEAPVLFFADRIWRRMGTRNMFLMCGAVMTFRHFGMAFINSPYLIFVLDTTHAFCFAATSFALARYVATSVIPELRTSGQMMIWGLALSCANVTSSLAGGSLIDLFGRVQPLYLFTGSICLVLVVGLFIYCRIFAPPAATQKMQ